MKQSSGFSKILVWVIILIPVILTAFMWLNEVPHTQKDLTLEVSRFSKILFPKTQWFYLSVNALTVIFPFLLSFDRKVAFFKTWKYLFPSIMLTMLVFIPWDIHFTQIFVWGFNPDYFLSDSKMLGLPLGEWLFFITVPYACVFIYECLRCYFDTPFIAGQLEKIISWFIVILLLVSGIVNYGKMYTATTFFLTASFLLFHLLIHGSEYRGRFYIAFIISLIPFLLVNGVLTGGFSEAPLVCYNDAENLSIRLISIPLDDVVYGFLLLFMATSWYEYFRGRKKSEKKLI